MTDVMTTEIDHVGQTQDEVGSSSGQSWSQYVTFMIDKRSYGIEITKVREIKGWSEPTELPSAPHAMRGVLNLRGVVVPIFDLRARFGRGETQVSEEHVVIIVALNDRLIGVLVDGVSDILTLEPGDVLPVPEMSAGTDRRCLSGLVSKDNQLVVLLRLEELFDLGGLPADMTF